MPKHAVVDGLTLAVIVSTLLSWLPPLAAGVSIVWYCVLIYEWNKKRKEKNGSSDCRPS